MCEMVFRERQERVSHMEAIAKMVATVFNTDAARAFNPVLAEYAGEVFQETYDPDLLRRRVVRRRAEQAAIRARLARDQEMLERLDKMGDYYDQNPPPATAPKKRNPNK